MSASFDLGPPTASPRSLFFKSQFSSVQWPPKSTSLTGQTAIITGSTSGLGLSASHQLLSFNLSTLILAVRSPQKGELIASQLRAQYPQANILVWPLEMESYDSIREFARRAEAELDRLDIVILNAGMQVKDFTLVSGTGHEKYIQVNYLSTMLLGILLLPVLKAKSPSGHPGRLSIVNSGTARGATIAKPPKDSPLLSVFDDPSRPWDSVERYAVSKLLGHLFIINLVQYVNADDVIVNLVDPGLVKDTNLQGSAPWLIRVIFYGFKAVFGRKLEVGASTYVDAVVVKGRESHGCFVSHWEVSSFAAFVYTPEGEAVRQQLWKETMAEFEFAGVQNILEGLKK